MNAGRASRNKLGLGTVQWGMQYGIANRHGRPAPSEIAALLQTAQDAGIALIDTAAVYGEAENVLGRHAPAVAQFRVVTKTLPVTTPTVDDATVKGIADAFDASLQRLGMTKVYGLLVHHGGNLLLPGGARLWDLLRRWKEEGRAERIGVSVYGPGEFRSIARLYAPEIVQLPLNVYDQRFIRSGALRMIKDAGIEVHVRSAFLQGLLLMGEAELPGHFSAIREHHRRFHAQLSAVNMTPLAAALKFALSQAEVDCVVVGCETVNQLTEILAAAAGAEDRLPSLAAFALDDEQYLNPSLWRPGPAAALLRV